MAGAELDLMRGTLDLLVMRALAAGSQHGFAVAQWIRHTTQGDLSIEDGALYTSLHRLEKRRLITGEWGLSDNNRKAKYYRLTPQGREALTRDTARWTAYAAAMFRVLKTQREAIRLLEQLG